MTDKPVPQWLQLELLANHPGVEVRWMDYGPRKTFVIPVYGDAFYRLVTKKLGSETVMYRRHITAMTDLKWKLHPLTYLPDTEHAPTGRWVVFQTNVATGELLKMFDVVLDDGSLHPLDRRVLDGILARDGKYGAHDRALADVEAAPDVAEGIAIANFEEQASDVFERIHFEVSKHPTPGAANAPVDPLFDENDISVYNEPASSEL
jgi:hypothetical protein